MYIFIYPRNAEELRWTRCKVFVHRDRIRIGNEGFMWRDGGRRNGEPGEKSLEQGQEPVTQTNANHFTV